MYTCGNSRSPQHVRTCKIGSHLSGKVGLHGDKVCPYTYQYWDALRSANYVLPKTVYLSREYWDGSAMGFEIPAPYNATYECR